METVNHIFLSCHFASAARQCTSHLFGINFVPNGSPLTFFLQALKASFSKQVMALLLSGIASCFSSIGMPRICVCMRGFWFLCIRFSLLSDKLLERLIPFKQVGCIIRLMSFLFYIGFMFMRFHRRLRKIIQVDWVLPISAGLAKSEY